MTERTIPARAYDLLDINDRKHVDDYVKYVVEEQKRKRERIIHALNEPIPSEYIRRSREALYKPLVRAALSERIREEADKQDLSPTRVLEEHASIAFSNITDYLDQADFGEVRLKQLKDISPQKMQAVKSIESKPGAFGLQTKITMHDKLPSLKTLGELMGLVAPDQPPALADYVRPLKDVSEQQAGLSADKEYAELLEHVSAGGV